MEIRSLKRWANVQSDRVELIYHKHSQTAANLLHVNHRSYRKNAFFFFNMKEQLSLNPDFECNKKFVFPAARRRFTVHKVIFVVGKNVEENEEKMQINCYSPVSQCQNKKRNTVLGQ